MAISNNLIRDGIVSTVDASTMTATVYFPDKDNTVSGPLQILGRGGGGVKDFWLPEPGDYVKCLMNQNNTTSLNQGCILGTYFNNQNPVPSGAKIGKRILDFGDGTTIVYDKNTQELNINCAGVIKINGSEIHLND